MLILNIFYNMFVFRCFGGEVSWDESVGIGSTYDESDESITHQVIDRPVIKKQVISRYILHFIFQCFVPSDGWFIPPRVLGLPNLNTFLADYSNIIFILDLVAETFNFFLPFLAKTSKFEKSLA